MGKWANKAVSPHTHTHTRAQAQARALTKMWLNPAGLQPSAFFALLSETFKNVCVCVCVTALSFSRQPPPTTRPPPGTNMSLHDSHAIRSPQYWETDRKTWRLRQEWGLKPEVRCVWSSVHERAYLFSSHAPGGGAGKWGGASGGGDCGLRAPTGHTQRCGGGPGKIRTWSSMIVASFVKNNSPDSSCSLAYPLFKQQTIKHQQRSDFSLTGSSFGLSLAFGENLGSNKVVLTLRFKTQQNFYAPLQ